MYRLILSDLDHTLIRSDDSISDQRLFVNKFLMINDKNFTNAAVVDFGLVFAYNNMELLWISIGRYKNGYEKATRTIWKLQYFHAEG